MTPLPNPFENFNSAAFDSPSSPADTVAAIVWPAPEAATVTNSESAASLPAQVERADMAGAVGNPPAPAGLSDTQDMPEPFSVYARRRSMPIISPPLNVERIGFNAIRAALNIHPRDLDEDPPPLFLRSPSKSFLNALFSIAFAPDRGERPDRSDHRSNNERKFQHRSSPLTG